MKKLLPALFLLSCNSPDAKIESPKSEKNIINELFIKGLKEEGTHDQFSYVIMNGNKGIPHETRCIYDRFNKPVMIQYQAWSDTTKTILGFFHDGALKMILADNRFNKEKVGTARYYFMNDSLIDKTEKNTSIEISDSLLGQFQEDYQYFLDKR